MLFRNCQWIRFLDESKQLQTQDWLISDGRLYKPFMEDRLGCVFLGLFKDQEENHTAAIDIHPSDELEEGSLCEVERRLQAGDWWMQRGCHAACSFFPRQDDFLS